MNTEKKVCPLAVMQNVIDIFPLFASVDGLSYSRFDMAISRAAVAELVAAQRKLLAFATACDDAMTACGRGISPDCEHGDVLRFSRAALAKFQGGAA